MELTNQVELENKMVMHKKFGIGIIIQKKDDKVIVRFNVDEKKFLFLNSFAEGILVALDPFVQEYIENVIKSEPKPEPKSEPKPILIDTRFDKDYHAEYLKKNPVYTYKEVEDHFNISLYPYGRGINITRDAIVLISIIKVDKSDYKCFVYHDHWTEDGDYIYSGEGKNGNQTNTRGNRALINAVNNGTKVQLLVKYPTKEYYYQGVFKVIDYSYEDDTDETNNIRKEYKFRIRKIED